LNDSVRPDSLILTLLVFGVFPRIVESNVLSPIVTQRAVILYKTIDEVRKLRAKHQINNILYTCNNPKINIIYDLFLNSLILV
jgi:hypothetical protein